ncbi:hypothetical protein [Gluconacetobacter entanii]|nr:hypothetical protein [Gluconacetobacter entanii]MCW4580989.1 hypothetical protein [Gluconacetobacter entanii]MCW4584342.1 hypothetical protein [Gluconacetobacter entanii]MCW4587756.1 hypothetical protein [Gluconacetobacter entanii]
MTPFSQGVMAGAGGVVVLIGLLVTIPLKLHAFYVAAQMRDRGLK